MRILHTSDWHLGKLLYNFSRLDEQEMFIDELEELADVRGIDMIIIAGDIYDVVNPSAAAEQLFYRAMKRLSLGGRRPVVIAAGNHDSPGRLTASSPLTTELGIIIFGTPESVITKGDYGSFKITDSGPGYICLETDNWRTVVAAIPYPSEKRLGELINDVAGDEKAYRKSYSDRICEIFTKLEQQYRPDAVNLAIGHFYVRGGEISDSERDISLGGSYAVSATALPESAQYIALGHLHRPQRVRGLPAYYSGSPIAYDIGESHTAKCVYIAEIKPGAEAKVEKAYLRNYKPMIFIKADSAREAVEEIAAQTADRLCWLIVRINVKRPLTLSEIKMIRQAGGDILEITCDAEEAQNENDAVEISDGLEMNQESQFAAFYFEKRGIKPSDELNALFAELSAMHYDGSEE